MDKDFSKRIIRNTFENKFDKSRFANFIVELLNLDSQVINEAYVSYNIDYIPGIYRPYIDSFEKIAGYESDGSKVDVLAIRLNKERSVERARTMQRNFVAWYLGGGCDGQQKDAVLAAFVSPDEYDWRFSLIKMDYSLYEDEKGKVKISEQFSPAKRWSFLVGSNERSHTAQIQLLKIVERDNKKITLGQLEEAFSVEKVTKEFFEKYRELFYRTNEALEEILKKDDRIRAEFEEKDIKTSDFAKKLLGQIVFLYFLQKKGWFGIEKDRNWGSGPKDFLRRLYNKKHNQYENFFNDILEPLFYEALRKDRSEVDGYYSRFNCKIPFLNGGLFDPINDYRWEMTDIFLPNELFSNEEPTKEKDTRDGILDILDRYNFTVQEDEPLEKEVAVDPEMLGKVFENLLLVKDRKSKGTYYTPREIVHYMCQQSLINYLKTELGDKVSKTDIETLVNIGDKIGGDTESSESLDLTLLSPILENAEAIDQKLASVKVCDPAVGSGAFLVGMMAEIVRIRNILSNYINDPERNNYNFKRECIEDSLYGVDIDPGAVEIAKLRLWLSLVVDEEDIKDIKPLPNLDYRIVCGNSLLNVELNLFNQEAFNKLEKLKPIYFSETDVNKKKEYKREIDELIFEVTNGHKEFDFEVYFSEVFHKKDGFDIVIANPPYIGQKSNSRLFSKMKKDPFFEKKMDYWYFFLHKSFNINKNAGITTFITPNYWITAKGGVKVRNKIVKNYCIKEWINFNENKVFEAGVHTNVFILQKQEPLNNMVKSTIYKNRYDKNIIVNKINEINYFTKQSRVLSEWTNYCHFLPEEIYRIVNKLTINSEKLCNEKTKQRARIGITAGKKLTDGICNLNQGLVTGKDRYVDRSQNVNNGVFILTAEEVKDLGLESKEMEKIRNFYKNSDIKRYFISNLPSYYLIYVNDVETEESLKQFKVLYKHLSNYKEILKKRSINGVLESAYKKGKWWALTTDRPNINFSDIKILCPQRSINNTFAYSDKECYASADVYYITQNKEEYSMKYILSILNSKIVYFWLYYMGKRKGEILELYLEPLQFIPVKRLSLEEQKPFINFVDKILSITRTSDYLKEYTKQTKVKSYEKQIDQMVYKLYGLTPEEIEIVENSVN
jgi:hypothetical protein